MENLGLGLILMVVGMMTVFCILLIVIYGSRGLISLINRIAPEEQRPAKAGNASQQGPANAWNASQQGSANAGNALQQGPDSRTISILEAAVAQLTGGRGHITNIKTIR